MVANAQLSLDLKAARRGTVRRPSRAVPCAVPPPSKVCSARPRRRTPPSFAEWLVELARLLPSALDLPANLMVNGGSSPS
jgi:hypothetical protein